MQDTTQGKDYLADEAGNRIAIVTTDASIDALVRDAFRDENYELITVANFAASQNKLVGSSLGIVHRRSYDDLETVRFTRDNEYWEEYPLIAIASRKFAEEQSDIMQGRSDYSYDMYLVVGFDPRELVYFAKRVIAASRDASPAP